MKDTFNMFINSKQSQEGPSVATGSLHFDFGSTYQQMTLLEPYIDLAYCYIRVRSFTINATPAVSTQASTLLICANLSQPCGAKTQTAGSNMITSDIIGIVPTNQGGRTYSPAFGYYENDWVKVQNPFKGIVNIQFKNETGEPLTLASTNVYEMLIQMYFDESC
jgi:hypothetical protein